MKHSIKVVDIIIQKKFKEFLDARRKGISYDFKGKLKKELKNTLKQLKHFNPDEKLEIQNLLQEIERSHVRSSYIQ